MDLNVSPHFVSISFSFTHALVSLGRPPSLVTGPSQSQMCFHFLDILFVALLNLIGKLSVLTIS